MQTKYYDYTQNLSTPVQLFEPKIQTFQSNQTEFYQLRSNPNQFDNVSVIITGIQNHYYQHDYVYEYVDVKEIHHYHHGTKEYGIYNNEFYLKDGLK